MDLKEKTIDDRMVQYYRGERITNTILFVLGLGTLVWIVIFYLWRHGQFSTGFLLSAIPLSSFMILTSGYRFVRSFERYKLIKNDDEGRSYLYTNELNFLEDRAVRFRVKRKFDSIGILLGFVLIVVGVMIHNNHILLATAINILGASATLLCYDLIGQFRTEEILHHLRKGPLS